LPFAFRVLSALFLLQLTAAPRHADERIRSFISAITMDDAGGLEVTETLDVQAERWSSDVPPHLAASNRAKARYIIACLQCRP
jgi:hypothetical protein